MTPKEKWIAFCTVVYQEISRTVRLWSQTLLPSAITTSLYFVIFGRVIGSRIGLMGGYSYIQYIAPGLIMMNIVTSSYMCAVGSFFSAKFQKNIEEILVSPMSNVSILLGYMSGGIFRGVVVGLIVTVISLLFTHLHIHSFLNVILSALLSSAIFSLAGVINAIIAKSFDDISIVPTFVLTPLTYLGGVFYSISLLPLIWQYVSLANPIVYIIDNFRYGFLGIVDSHVLAAYFVMVFFLIILFYFALRLIKIGTGLRE